MKLFSVKPASRPYTCSMLPKNRREVFFDILRLHWGKFFWMGVLIFLFSLPLHLCALLWDHMAEQTGQALEQWQNLRLIVNIPLLMLPFIPIAGLLRIMRQYAWGENVFFFYDLSKGLRQNSLQTLLVTLVGSSAFMLAAVCFRTAAAAGGSISYAAGIPMGIFLFLIFPLCCYVLTALPVYSNTSIANWKLALAVYSKSPLKSLLMLGCLCAPLLASYVPNMYFHIIGRILSSLYMPILLLAWTLFCYDQFDQHINTQEYPELVNKGVLGLQYQDRSPH